MQGKFKHATGSVMAQANARNYALGVEGLSYEGPLRVRLPVKKKLDPDGSFSFEIPLPNPDRQVILKRFAGGFKQALSSPLTVHQVASQIAAQTAAAAEPGSAPQSPAPGQSHLFHACHCYVHCHVLLFLLCATWLVGCGRPCLLVSHHVWLSCFSCCV